MEWQLKAFQELSLDELYEIIKLRINVFVVEQTCPYQELDDFDRDAVHLCAWEHGRLVAYARILKAGSKYNEASIGRVIVNPVDRSRGFGKMLFRRALNYCTEVLNETKVKIQAQTYLRAFYGSFGFQEISDVYDEDGIPHVDMMKS
ncbi:GNAT family N-acetyltransferase [Halalkalibacterium ligniniphilum]|uniref:GNAT family N-acetyltransferase n=1 Tax=Halalkalibacterium ligniniphilum TaxID=1134413 RepID=UPI000349AC04|nr:GNAT family N-acetyltransferase [Halalkalibacterium ligniniphilum]